RPGGSRSVAMSGRGLAQEPSSLLLHRGADCSFWRPIHRLSRPARRWLGRIRVDLAGQGSRRLVFASQGPLWTLRQICQQGSGTDLKGKVAEESNACRKSRRQLVIWVIQPEGIFCGACCSLGRRSFSQCFLDFSTPSVRFPPRRPRVWGQLLVGSQKLLRLSACLLLWCSK